MAFKRFLKGRPVLSLFKTAFEAFSIWRFGVRRLEVLRLEVSRSRLLRSRSCLRFGDTKVLCQVRLATGASRCKSLAKKNKKGPAQNTNYLLTISPASFRVHDTGHLGADEFPIRGN